MNKRGAYQKKAQNLENVKARHSLLVAGLASPERISQSVAKAMEGQRAFCNLNLPGSGIEPLALNTLKSLTHELYSKHEEAEGDGFLYFDGLRTRLKSLVDARPRGRSAQAKASRQNELQKDLEGKLHAVEQLNIRRSKAYLDLFKKLNTFIKEAMIDDTTRLRLFNILENHHLVYAPLFKPTDENSGGDTAVVLAWPGSREE